MSTNLSSCEFLIKQSANSFIPEEFDEETLMIADTCKDFLDNEVFPIQREIDEKEDEIMTSLLRKSADLGLLGLTVPEQYGGFPINFIGSIKSGESFGGAGSFSVAHMCHIGIGTMPIVCYGNEEQKMKYLPDLVTGKRFSCFCLTEPDAGSDANAGRTTAVLSPDGGHYILNGQKVFITNSGFADIQVVFAKIEDDRVLSAFIVERAWDGVSVATEEHKMGIRGTSTRQIFYNNVKVPAENLLGRRGEGYRIALNILHLGRVKLASLALGGSKKSIEYSVNYANERRQFGKSIACFGAVKQMLAQQTIKTFAIESALYRAASSIQNRYEELIAAGKTEGTATIEAVADYQSECAMLKVIASECQDMVVDNAVQILGGIGYVSSMPVERAYRDSRINRIYEGTNEINRLLTVDYIIKRAIRNRDYPLFDMAEKAEKQTCSDDATFAEKQNAALCNLKAVCNKAILAFHAKHESDFNDQEELMQNIFDIVSNIYVAESVLLRVNKVMDGKLRANTEVYKCIAETVMHDVGMAIFEKGMSMAGSLQDKALYDSVKEFVSFNLVNIKENQRVVADKLIADNQYKF